MAFGLNKNTEIGESISTQEAEDAIFGMVIFNDWSARDIQSWEYVPLGPFLGKNFCSSISPWVVTLEALEPFRTASPKQEPEVLDYLKFEGDKNFDINSRSVFTTRKRRRKPHLPKQLQILVLEYDATIGSITPSMVVMWKLAIYMLLELFLEVNRIVLVQC